MVIWGGLTNSCERRDVKKAKEKRKDIPIWMKYSFGISNFLEEILSFPFYCFPLFLCTDHWGNLSYFALLFFGTLHSSGYVFPFLLCFSLFFFLNFFKASSDNHFAFLCFFFLGMVLITSSCTMSRTSVHSSLGPLSDLILWIYLSLPLYNHKGFDLGHTWMVSWLSLLSSI